MKKFIITEEERSRILDMHKTATSRQYLMEEVAKKLCHILATRIVEALNAKINEFKIKNPNSPTSTFTVKEWPTKESETTKYGIFYSGQDLFNEQGFTDSDLTDNSMVIDQNKTDQAIIRYRNMINNTFNTSNLNPIFGKVGNQKLKNINMMDEFKNLALKIFNNWVLEIKPKVPTNKKPQKP